MRLNLSAKCVDMCCIDIYDDFGNKVYEHDGYVPDFMPGEHFGDYIELVIDVDTGVILNWEAGPVRKSVKS